MRKKKRYSKTFRLNVVEEALKEEYKDNIYLIANKYNIRESTVERWKNNYLRYGHKGLSVGFDPKIFNEGLKIKDKELEAKDKEIKELKEENEILKKAAAFLAKLDRN